VRALELAVRLLAREKVVDWNSSKELKDLNMVCALDRSGGDRKFTG
jgi:hypothetical protein